MTMCGEPASPLAGLMTQEQRNLVDSLCEGTEVPAGEAEAYARALRTARRHIAAMEARLERVGTAVQLGAEHDAVTREAAREQVRDLSREYETLQSKVAELEAALELALTVARAAPADRPVQCGMGGDEGAEAPRARIAPTPTPEGPTMAEEPRCTFPYGLSCLVHEDVLTGKVKACAACAPHVADTQPEPATRSGEEVNRG